MSEENQSASFGNVHGAYKPGNVKLEPLILKNAQRYFQQKDNTQDNPVSFVFHGGSGSEVEKTWRQYGMEL